MGTEILDSGGPERRPRRERPDLPHGPVLEVSPPAPSPAAGPGAHQVADLDAAHGANHDAAHGSGPGPGADPGRPGARARVTAVAAAAAVVLAAGYVGWTEGGERGRQEGEKAARVESLAALPVTGWLDGFGEARPGPGDGRGVIDASLLVVNAGAEPVSVTDVRVATLLPAQGGPPRVSVEPAASMPLDLAARSSDRVALTVTADCGNLRPRRTVVEALVQTARGERWVPMATSGPGAALATGVARACRRVGSGVGGLDVRTEYRPRGLRITVTNGNRATRTVDLEAVAPALLVDTSPPQPWRLESGGSVTVEVLMRLATCLPGAEADVPDIELRVLDGDGQVRETLPVGGQALVAYGAARQRACTTRDRP